LYEDEESLRAIRSWWSRYAPAAALVLILGGGGYGGWQYWKEQERQYHLEAAVLYRDISLALDADAEGIPIPDDLQETSLVSARRLIEDYPDLLYATLASLYLASQHVSGTQPQAAIEVLESALQTSELSSVRDIIRLRIARLHLALNDPESTRSILTALETPASAVRAAEIRGDSFYLEQDYTAAATSYRVALAQLPEGSPFRVYLNWKLQGLTSGTSADGSSSVGQNAIQ